jgi:hypothetical protein
MHLIATNIFDVGVTKTTPTKAVKLRDLMKIRILRSRREIAHGPRSGRRAPSGDRYFLRSLAADQIAAIDALGLRDPQPV